MGKHKKKIVCMSLLEIITSYGVVTPDCCVGGDPRSLCCKGYSLAIRFAYQGCNKKYKTNDANENHIRDCHTKILLYARLLSSVELLFTTEELQ